MRKIAWLSFINGILEIPVLLTTLALEIFTKTEPNLEIVKDGIAVVTLILFVVIYQGLRKLLSERLQFTKVDSLLFALMVIETVYVIYDCLNIHLAVSQEMLITMVGLVAEGLILIWLGLRLSKLEYQFDGLLKSFCYATIANGICLVIMALLGVCCGVTPDGFWAVTILLLLLFETVISLFADIVLGIIFWHAADQFPKK